MEKLSAPEPRYTVLCPEHMLFDMQNGTWFVETIHEREGQRPSDPRKQAPLMVCKQTTAGQREHKTASDKHKSHQKCLAKQEPSTQDKVGWLLIYISPTYDVSATLGQCRDHHAAC
jgi:hypothetical protein